MMPVRSLLVFLTLMFLAPGNTEAQKKPSVPTPRPYCGLKVCLTIEQGISFKPLLKELYNPTEEIGILVDPRGTITRFAADEVIFKPRDIKHLREFLAKTGARIHRSYTPPPPPPSPGVSEKKRRRFSRDRGYLTLKVPPQENDPENLLRRLDSWDRSTRGTYRMNEKGAKLIHFFLKQLSVGNDISLNILLEPSDHRRVLSETSEGLVGDAVQDAFDWPYVGNPNIGLNKAWQYIDLLHPPAATANPYTEEREDKVFVAFVDDGFKETQDLVPTHLTLDGWNSDWGQGCIWFDENILHSCDSRGPRWDYTVMNEPDVQQTRQDGELTPVQPLVCDPWCWHGFNVHSVAATLLDNRNGVAGPGGQVIFPMLFRSPMFRENIADLIAIAIDWGADIISLSFGDLNPMGQRDDRSGLPHGVREVYEEAVEAGVIVIAGAGNDNQDLDENSFLPCEFEGVICVGAGSEERWVNDPPSPSGSNYGTNVDIWAPGPVKLLSSTHCSAEAPCDMTVEELGNAPVTISEGRSTSHAAPFIAGVVAMMKAIRPSLTPAEAATILQETATPSPDPTVANGYVNVRRAIERTMELEGVSLPSDGNNSFAEAETIEMTPDRIDYFVGASGSIEGTITPYGDADFYRLPSYGTDYTSLTAEIDAENINVNGLIAGQLRHGDFLIRLGWTGLPISEETIPPGGERNLRIYGITPDNVFNGYRINVRIEPAEIRPDRYDDQTPEEEIRNDSPQNASWLRREEEHFTFFGRVQHEHGEVTAQALRNPFGAQVMDLNFDLRRPPPEGIGPPNYEEQDQPDRDHFLLELPGEVQSSSFTLEDGTQIGRNRDCLTAGQLDQLGDHVRATWGNMFDPGYEPGYIEVTIDPVHTSGHHRFEDFDIQLYNGNQWINLGTLGNSVGTASPTRPVIGRRLECPHQVIPNGIVGIRVMPNGNRWQNFYNLTIKYHGWSYMPRISEEEMERVRRISFMEGVFRTFRVFPSEPQQMDFCLRDGCPDPAPELIPFEAEQEMENVAMAVVASPACQMQIRLLDGNKNLIREGTLLGEEKSKEFKEIQKKTDKEIPKEIPLKDKVDGIFMRALPKGHYSIEIDGNPCDYQLHLGRVANEGKWPFVGIEAKKPPNQIKKSIKKRVEKIREKTKRLFKKN